MRCTLGALVACQVVPFLPTPHIDIRLQQSSHATLIPRVYSSDHKLFFESSIEWDTRFSCRIWHEFQGNKIVWFGNKAIRLFLSMLLFPNEGALYMLGVRWARRGSPNVITLWGPVVKLDNHSVLALLVKILASVSDTSTQ